MSLHSLVWVLGIWQPNDCPANRLWIILAYEPFGVTGVYPTSTPLKGVSSSKRSGTYRVSQIAAPWRITWHTQKSLPISSLDWLVKIHQHNMCAVCPCNNSPNDPHLRPPSPPLLRSLCTRSLKASCLATIEPIRSWHWKMLLETTSSPVPRKGCMHPKQNKYGTIRKIGSKMATVWGKKHIQVFL